MTAIMFVNKLTAEVAMLLKMCQYLQVNNAYQTPFYFLSKTTIGIALERTRHFGDNCRFSRSFRRPKRKGHIDLVSHSDQTVKDTQI